MCTVLMGACYSVYGINGSMLQCEMDVNNLWRMLLPTTDNPKQTEAL